MYYNEIGYHAFHNNGYCAFPNNSVQTEKLLVDNCCIIVLVLPNITFIFVGTELMFYDNVVFLPLPQKVLSFAFRQ